MIVLVFVRCLLVDCVSEKVIMLYFVVMVLVSCSSGICCICSDCCIRNG